MDIGNLNIFNKKKSENDTSIRSGPKKGKEQASLNDMMHQVGDYDMTTSSAKQNKDNKSSNNDDDDSDESSKSSAKNAAANAIATAASVIAPTTATAPVVPPHDYYPSDA